MERMTKIRITGVHKSFTGPNGPIEVLRDVNLDVDEGEFVCLVGPSGCGKTTLLRMIGGLEPVTAGSITISANGHKPESAMVFQDHCIFPWFTVKENIEYGLRIKRMPRDTREAICRKLVEMTGLRGFEEAYPYQLSGGMKQRVNVARAVAIDPDVLLMDEPFGALDEHTRMLMQFELLQIWEGSGKTVIFVTHSVDEAINLADRVVVMTARPGRVKTIVPIDIQRPRHPTEIRWHRSYPELLTRIWHALQEEVT
ncbi:MAG TPA: ABC transporter ATP-binding protein [Firmicutes bacterium]|nr:ABC transporter ATP-binding protein [Bacillota bacterium]